MQRAPHVTEGLAIGVPGPLVRIDGEEVRERGGCADARIGQRDLVDRGRLDRRSGRRVEQGRDRGAHLLLLGAGRALRLDAPTPEPPLRLHGAGPYGVPTPAMHVGRADRGRTGRGNRSARDAVSRRRRLIRCIPIDRFARGRVEIVRVGSRCSRRDLRLALAPCGAVGRQGRAGHLVGDRASSPPAYGSNCSAAPSGPPARAAKGRGAGLGERAPRVPPLEMRGFADAEAAARALRLFSS